MQKAISKYWPVFVLPTLIAFIIGFIWPFIWGTYLSFQRFTTVSKTTFVGIQNYISVFQDSTFLHAFGFTAVFTVVSTVLINVCAFAIALVLTRGIKGTNLFRTVYFMPNLIGGILLGYIWQILLNGVLANLQKPLLALDAKAGFIGLVILMCWQQIGYMMIIYVAGLQSVPGDLIEAAKIDGANDREILFKIKRKIVILGGGSVGCETADYLAPLINDLFPANRDVTILEMTPSLMTGEGGAAKSQLTQRLMRKGVKIELNSQVTKVDENTITYVKEGVEHHIDDADTLVFAVGYIPLKMENERANYIGDCDKVGNLKDAIGAAYQLAKTL